MRERAKKNCGAVSGLAGPDELGLHAAFELSRADPDEGDAVAVVGVHVGLDLEDEGRHLRLGRMHGPAVGFLVARRRAEIAERLDQVAHAEIPERRSEEDRCQVPLAERLQVEWAAGLAREFQFVDEGGPVIVGQQAGDLVRIRTVDLRALDLAVGLAHRVLSQVIGPGKGAAVADRPCDGRGVQCELLLDLVQYLERVARLAVHLVDEGDDRDVAQPADLEELQRARLDALGAVDDHDGEVDRRERAVGVVGEILMAGRIQQVEDVFAILERHHRGHDRDAALALDLHPVGPRLDAVLLGLHLAGELDRAAEQQQLLGQRRLARVRVGDDGECAPARHRLFDCLGHERISVRMGRI
jgi:hypothetical protein